MSSELLSDHEQEEALRSWFRENWTWIASGVAVGFIVLAGWTYWQRRVEQQGESAAQVYRDLQQALAQNDKDKVDAAAKRLDAEFGSSPYPDQAHLLLAQAHVNGGRFEMAATELKGVVANSKDEALAQIAKLRLARVEIQLGHYDEVLALLDVTKGGVFVAQYHEIRGDALLAKGDAAGARAAYQAAIDAQAGDRNRSGADQYLQLKLSDLTALSDAAASAGTVPATPAPTPATPTK